MPEISIIVPVYNTEKYIHRCIDSILAQTFKDFECIIINDGSTDNCPVICDEYASKDKRVIVIHKKNNGVSAARNTGLDITRGEWIGFVDSDDWCDPDMFSKLYENAIKYDADVSICGVRRVIKDKIKEENITNKIKIFNGEKAILKMFSFDMSFCGFSCNKLVKTKVFSRNRLRYDTTVLYMEDVLLFYNIFKLIEKVVYYSIPYYNYLKHSESVTGQFGLTEASKTAFFTLDKIIALEKKTNIKNKIIAFKVNFAYDISVHYIKLNDYYNDDFILLRKYILKKIYYFLLNISFPIIKKIKCCLIIWPYAYNRISYFWKNKTIFHEKQSN